MLIVNATGRLIKDAELKYIPNSGMAVLSFGLASNRIYAKEGADSDIINCQIWGKRAESLAAILTKGYLVQLVGELQSNKDKMGTYWWTCNVKELQLLSKPVQKTQQPIQKPAENVEPVFDANFDDDAFPF